MRISDWSSDVCSSDLSVFVAGSFGLVALIADGYRCLAYLFLLIYVAPLLTIGLWRLGRDRKQGLEASDIMTRDLHAASPDPGPARLSKRIDCRGFSSKFTITKYVSNYRTSR